MADYEIVIVGGGIAGLTAALTAARMGRRTLIITGGVPGGELLNIEKVEGVPGHEDGIAGFDLCPIAQELADAAGAVFDMQQATAIEPDGEAWKVSTATGAFTAPAVILATGAHVARLGVPGEEEFAGKGVSHCATCDGPLLRGKIAVVAGGGDSGMQESLTLAPHVARVILVEQSGALTGQAAYIAQVEGESKIEVRTGCKLVAIEGGSNVEGVRLCDVASAEEVSVEAQGVFSFTGLTPNAELARGVVAIDGAGRADVDAALRTTARGIFAAGNVRAGNGWRAAAAMGDGATAATSADAYLKHGAWRD